VTTPTTPPTPSADAPAPSPWRIYRLIVGAVILATLNYSVVFVAFGDIEASFDASPAALSWTLTAYSITVAALLVPGGWLADRYGRSRVFISGFGLFLFGSLLVAVAPRVEVLVAARVIQAAGLAIESPASLAIVLDAFPKSRRSTAVGAMGAIGGVAAAIGPAVGGALVEWIGWRGTFLINVPVGLVVIALVWPRLPPDHPRTDAGAPDLAGVALLVAGVGALALGIVQSDEWGFADPRTLTALTAAAVMIALLIRRSASHPEPILYLPLFRVHDFRVGAVLAFLVAGTFSGTFFAFITFFTQGWDLSLFRAGLTVGLIPAIGGPMSVVAGRIADRRGHRWVIAPGAVAIAAAALIMYVFVDEQRALVQLWLPVGVLYAVGVGLAHAACQAAALAETPEGRLGIGGAMNRIFQDVGGTMSVAAVIALQVRYPDPVDALRATMIGLAVISAVAIPIAWRLHGRGQFVTTAGSTTTGAA